MLDYLTKIAFGYTSSFNEFERLVLDAFISKLPLLLKVKMESRINSINRIYRLDGGREVDCYHIVGGKPVFRDAITEQHGEFKVSDFEVVSEDEMTKNRGCIYLVNGNFFSIEFENSTEHSNVNMVSRVEIEIKK